MNTQDKQINSAVNSCRMALYNNNKAKSTNKTTRLINNLLKNTEKMTPKMKKRMRVLRLIHYL